LLLVTRGSLFCTVAVGPEKIAIFGFAMAHPSASFLAHSFLALLACSSLAFSLAF
jgi:hypothetical protein